MTVPPPTGAALAVVHDELYHGPRWLTMLGETLVHRLHCLTMRDAVGIVAVAEFPACSARDGS